MRTQTVKTLEGVVEGATSLMSLVVLPLRARGVVVGILALGNRDSGYPPQLLRWLEPLVLVSTHLVSEVSLMRAQFRIKDLEVAKKKAEVENIAKSAFLAHMAHELRTPLSGIIGLLDLINETSLNPQEVGYLDMSKESAGSLLNILNDILDISAVEAGQLKLEEVIFNPRTIAEDVRRLLSLQAEKKGISLIFHHEPCIPKSLVGDPSRFRQILFNLIGNALKFTERGTIEVSFRGSPNPTSSSFTLKSSVRKVNYTLDTTVQDSGMGMTPETISSLFRPFAQGDPSISRRFGGTGLGLFICKQLCTLMGGDIDVTSTFEQGSIFHFSVQLGLPSRDESREAAPATQVSMLPPLRILVAEDNAVNQLIMREMLKVSSKENNYSSPTTNRPTFLEKRLHFGLDGVERGTGCGSLDGRIL
jgi:signal transduction histidine kinase